MDKKEKRPLKKRGKQAVADRSREWQERLGEANSAPIGSDGWAKSYLDGTLKEKVPRANPPDRLGVPELAESFVVSPAIQDLTTGGPSWEDHGHRLGSALRPTTAASK
jgi:hypothetical protein